MQLFFRVERKQVAPVVPVKTMEVQVKKEMGRALLYALFLLLVAFIVPFFVQ